MISDISVSTGDIVPEKMAVPMRMVQARLREKTVIDHNRLPWGQRIRDCFRRRQENDISCRYFLFNVKWYGYRIFAILGMVLVIVLLIESVFWIWIWQLPPEKFNRLAACLDAGVVPSVRERMVYHLACFWGSL